MNKQAYEHTVGVLLNKKAYDWKALIESAKDTIKEHPEATITALSSIIGGSSGALVDKKNRLRGLIAGALMGGAAGNGVYHGYNWLTEPKRLTEGAVNAGALSGDNPGSSPAIQPGQ